MKKLATIIALAALLLPSMVLAAGTITDADGGTLTAADWVQTAIGYQVTFILTDTGGSGFSATIPLTADQAAANLWIYSLQTDPGATAPTDDYDLTVVDSTGVSVFGTGCNDRDTSNTEICSTDNDAYVQYNSGNLTITVANNSQAGALVTCILTLVR